MQYLGPHPDLLHQNEHLHKTPGGSLRTVKLGLQATRPGTQLHFLPSRSHPLSLHPVSGELLTLLFSLKFCSHERILILTSLFPLQGIQLTLEKHGFELHRSTYMGSFSIVHDPWLVDSMDTELQIQRDDYKIIHKVDL